MATTTGYIAERNFTQITTTHYTYASAAPERAGKLYDIRYINGKWQCSCPDARGKRAAGYGQRCKHERGLCQRIRAIQASSSRPERQAEEIVARAEESAEIAALRAEIAAMKASQDAESWELRTEIAHLRSQLFIQSQSQPAADMAAILAELASLRTENSEIKKILATKATARRKHASEQESAECKRAINCALDEAVESAQAAIAAAGIARAELAALEAIPHSLKQELDRQAEAGKEELQPDYKPAEANSDEVRSAVRGAQESERKRREATLEERREMAPLNGNGGFQFYR